MPPETSRSCWVAQLAEGASIREKFVVRAKDARQGRGGGSYLTLGLGDRTGEVTAMVWDNVADVDKVCQVGAVVTIIGRVQRYNGRLQVVVKEAMPVRLADVDQGDFVRASQIDPDLLWSQLQEAIAGVADGHLRQLLYRVFSDPEVAERFKVVPAARGMHHAFRSGLLEHTVSVVGAARPLARHYRLNESLVVAGCLLHDLGKVWELESGASIEYTDEGRLIGHLTLEVMYVDRMIGELASFPAETRRQLLHILLAHHGEYEYGSPRRPKTPEAQLVHVVDNLDARLSGMFEAINGAGDDESAWSPYSRMLDRMVYRRRLPEG